MLKDTKIRFLQLERTQLPQFDSQYHSTANTILLINVLQHIIYPGSNPVESKIMFLKALLPLLKPGGKILIDISHSSGDLLRNNPLFNESINADEELKGKVVFSE